METVKAIDADKMARYKNNIKLPKGFAVKKSATQPDNADMFGAPMMGSVDRILIAPHLPKC